MKLVTLHTADGESYQAEYGPQGFTFVNLGSRVNGEFIETFGGQHIAVRHIVRMDGLDAAVRKADGAPPMTGPCVCGVAPGTDPKHHRAECGIFKAWIEEETDAQAEKMTAEKLRPYGLSDGRSSPECTCGTTEPVRLGHRSDCAVVQ